MTRICFLNPFGTDQFDELVGDTLRPYLRPGTEVEITHLEDCPRNATHKPHWSLAWAIAPATGPPFH